MFHLRHTNVTQRFLRLVVTSAKQQHAKYGSRASQHSGPNGRYDPDQKMHTYEIRPREDHHGVDLISHMLPFGRLLYLEVREAVAYAKFYSRSQTTVIRVYDAASNVIETHEHAGDFKEP